MHTAITTGTDGRYVVTVTDPLGRVVMTFHTGNEFEAQTIGDEMLAFLGA